MSPCNKNDKKLIDIFYCFYNVKNTLKSIINHNYIICRNNFYCKQDTAG